MALSNRLLTAEDVNRCGGGGSPTFIIRAAKYGHTGPFPEALFAYADVYEVFKHNHLVATWEDPSTFKPLNIQLMITMGDYNYQANADISTGCACYPAIMIEFLSDDEENGIDEKHFRMVFANGTGYALTESGQLIELQNVM